MPLPLDIPNGRFALVAGTWAALGPEARMVRMAVFVHEQGIDEAEEWDAADAAAVHAVVRKWPHDTAGGDPMNQTMRAADPVAIATGRLLVHKPGVGRVGRMSVLRAYRNCGVGQMLLEGLMAVSVARNDHQLMLHAQCTAQQLYARAGFVVCGAPFDEVGIPHVAMQRTLQAR